MRKMKKAWRGGRKKGDLWRKMEGSSKYYHHCSLAAEKKNSNSEKEKEKEGRKEEKEEEREETKIERAGVVAWRRSALMEKTC